MASEKNGNFFFPFLSQLFLALKYMVLGSICDLYKEDIFAQFALIS